MDGTIAVSSLAPDFSSAEWFHYVTPHLVNDYTEGDELEGSF